MSARKSVHHTFVARYGVPSGWAEVRLRDAVEIVGGGTPDTSDPRFWNGDIPWLTPTEMTSLRGRLATTSERKVTQLALQSSNCRLLSPGALVISMRGTIGNIAIAAVPLTCNQSCEALLPRENVNNEYLYYLLVFLRPLLERLGAGTTFTSVTRRDIRDIRFALPTEPKEQQSIAETLVAVDEANAAAQAKLTVGRRLKIALMQQLFTRGIPGRHARFKTGRVFRHEFEVPKTWEVAPLRSSVTCVEYGTNAPSNDEERGLPVVAIPEVIASRFRLGECSYAEVPEHEAAALRLESDDVLLVRTNGNPDYIGKSTVVGDEAANHHMIFASYLIRVRTNKDKVSGKYLNYFLSSPLGRRQCFAMANTSAGNHNLGSRSIKQFVFPRPNPEEQEEIVRIIDSVEDTIESSQSQIASVERLRRSLLQNLLTGRVRVRM
jgi:type I restriction enzyme S subunit